MRIPSDIAPSSFAETERATAPERTRAEPVESLPGLGEERPQSNPRQRRFVVEDPNAKQNHSWRRVHGKDEQEDRRKDERRKEKRPVVLDTRLTRSCRRSSLHPRVDLKI